MSPHLPLPTHTPGFIVLDAELPDRPALGYAEDYEAALCMLAGVQDEFYDQLDATGEGGVRARVALTLAPVDAAGTIGPPCSWASINGMRPAER